MFNFKSVVNPLITSRATVRASRIATRELALGCALALAAVAPSAFAADKPLTVMEKVDLPVAPATAWETIKDFDGWQYWHPAIANTNIIKGKGNTKGTVRVLTTGDGAKITEELLRHDDKSMTYQYKFTDSPLPVSNYVSTIKIVKTKDGSAVVWSSSFVAKQGTTDEDAKKVITGIYTAGLDNLKSKLK
jgi:mxaD protein